MTAAITLADSHRLVTDRTVMTYPSQHQPPYVPGAVPPAPERRGWLPWILGGSAVLLVALAVAAGLAALAGQDDGPAAAMTSAPTAIATTAAALDYDTAQRLVGALGEAGIDCVNWERTDNPLRAVELGSCYVGTEQVVVSIFASREDAAGEPAFKSGLLAGVSDVSMVIGGNWTLSCDDANLCMRIATDFGGAFKHIPA